MSAAAGLRGAAEMVPIEHETSERVVRTMVFALPPAAVCLGGWLAWGGALHWPDLLVLAIMYTFTGLGITVGYHRLFTHRSFKTTRTLRALLAVLGSMAVEGPVIEWVATHHKHHSFSDRPGDPHSPHVGHPPGWRGELHGLAHAHLGWMFRGKDMANPARYAKDLLADRDVRLISRTFPLWVAAGLALPFGLGVALTDSVVGGSPDCCGVERCASSCCITRRSVSTRCATTSDGDRSPPAMSRETSRGSRRSPSGRRGTTTTMPSRPRRDTDWGAGRSTPVPGSSPGWSAATSPGTSSGSVSRASKPNAGPPSLLEPPQSAVTSSPRS